MQINSSKKKSKGLFLIALFCIVSVVLNIILSVNLKNYDVIQANNKIDELLEKDEEIRLLEGEVRTLTLELEETDPVFRENNSVTELENQRKVKEFAAEFVRHYFNYDSQSLDERREQLKGLTTKEILDQVAPEITVNESEQPLSSDPTFVSTVEDMTVYMTETNKALGEMKLLIDVHYKASGSDGSVDTRGFISTIVTVGDDMKITDYKYYQID